MYDHEIKQTQKDFARCWPDFSHKLGGGTITAIEGRPDELSRWLDLKTGTDALQRWPDGRTRYLATRCLYTSFDTITIRCKTRNGGMTEMDKYERAVQEGLFVPDMLVCAYVDDDGARFVMAATIPQLVDAVQYGVDRGELRPIGVGGGNSMYALSQKLLTEHAMRQCWKTPVVFSRGEDVNLDMFA